MNGAAIVHDVRAAAPRRIETFIIAKPIVDVEVLGK
jgi:hypothetical protein